MFKQSFQVVLIQIAGIVLGFFSVYFIAGDMDPEVYSLVGVFSVVNNILVTFTDLGIETTMMREALFWRKNGEEEKIAEYTSQALFSRLIGFCAFAPFLLIYLLVLNSIKYNHQYTLLMITFLIGSWISALNDSMTLIIRSTGGYVFSSLAKTASLYIIKFLGILIYYWKGSTVYLYFYALSSIPILFIFVYKLRRNFKLRCVKFKPAIRKIYDARYLWLNTDLGYFKNHADSLLVSAVFSPTIMGSYTLYKTFEGMVKSCIEGFFDVLSQSTVKYKGDYDALEKKEKQIKYARNLIIVLICVGILVFSFAGSWLVDLIHLQKYDYIEQIIICAALSGAAYMIGKYEINAISFFGKPILNFKITGIVFSVSIISYVIVIINNKIYEVLLQRIAIILINSLIAIYYFKKYKNEMYTNIKGE